MNGTSIEADRAGDLSHDNTDLAALALDGVAENQGRQAGLCRSVGRRRQGKWRSGDDSDTSRRRALPVSRDDDTCEIDVAPCSIQRRHGNRRLARANYDAPALGFSGRCRRTAAPGPALATAASKISRSPARVHRSSRLTTARQTLELWMASTTALVTSLVVAFPPTSGVRMPAPVTFSTARISRAEASVSPR